MDRFNNTNSAINLNDGYFTLPPGFYISENFTVTLWIKIVKITKFARVFEFGNGLFQDNIILAYTMVNISRPYFGIVRNNNETRLGNYFNSLRLGAWEFLCFTLDNGIGRIYLNGVKIAEGNISIPLNINRNKKLFRQK